MIRAHVQKYTHVYLSHTMYHMVARGVGRSTEWTDSRCHSFYELHLFEQKLHKNDDNILFANRNKKLPTQFNVARMIRNNWNRNTVKIELQ